MTAPLMPSINVPRETMEKLESFVLLLHKWQRSINLISPTTLDHVWQRHILDSTQLLSYIPSTATSLVDFGSGAGFPGMVLAIQGTKNVHLIESDTRKCVFLREVARCTNTDVTIHHGRIETIHPIPASVITSRACASLLQLLEYSERFLCPDTVCLFPKGENYTKELEEARIRFHFDCTTSPSLSQSSAMILNIQHVKRVS